MTSRNPIEFTDITHKRVGNRIVITDATGNPVSANNPQFTQIQSADSPSIDAFGRFRITQPYTIFDSKQINDKQPLFWDDQETSGGGTSSTYNTNQASTTIAVTANTAGTRTRQTFRRFNYQPGKSQLVFMTFAMGENVAGVTKRLGYYDANNGIFLQSDSTGASVVIRSNVTGTPVPNQVYQPNWNLDTLDGSGDANNPSGLEIDLSKTQILVIDFEWLGVGRVRLGFNINGLTYYVHEFLNSNNLTTVYMSTPNLPLRYEISNNGAGAAASLVHICSSVMSEGGLEFNGFDLSVDRGITPLTTLNNTSIYPLIAIRLKTAYQGITIKISDLSILTTTTADFRWSLLLNPTVVGTALSFTSVTNSAIEAQVNTTSATTITAGTGTRLASGYLSSTAVNRPELDKEVTGQLTLGASIAGVSDILVLCVQNLSSGVEDYFASLTWKETV